MEDVVIETEDEEYYEIFSSSLFDGKMRKKPLNWLEQSDRKQKKKESEDE
jgi:hypothetical protein